MSRASTSENRLTDLEQAGPFSARHIGTLEPADRRRMLDLVGYASMDDLLAGGFPVSARPGHGLHGRPVRPPG